MAGPAEQSTPANNSPADRAKRQFILSVMTAVFLFIAVIYSIYWLGWGRFREYTEDAYVTGNLVQLMPQVSGTIISINTDNTNLVVEGQTVIQLDPTDMTVHLQNAAATLADTVREVRQYYEDVRSDLAIVQLRQANLEKAEYDFNRRKGLVQQRAISAEEMQHITIAVQSAKAQLDSSLAKLATAIALVENSHLYQHPKVEKAKATLETAYLNWVRTTINAPVTGYVAKRTAQVGQQINPGTALLSIVPLNQIWVDANFKESQLSRVRIGQDVILTADAYGGLKFHGKVVGLSPGTGTAFDLLPPQNATGNWIKIVQRLPVRISLDPQEIAQHPLRIGLSMRVTVYTRGLKGEVLSKYVNQRPIYSTNIYEKQLADAKYVIDKIIRANAPDVEIKGMPLGTNHAV